MRGRRCVLIAVGLCVLVQCVILGNGLAQSTSSSASRSKIGAAVPTISMADSSMDDVARYANDQGIINQSQGIAHQAMPGRLLSRKLVEEHIRITPEWLRSPLRERAMKEQQISHVLVFSNSMLAHNWSFMDLHRALNLSIERTVLIFCNHGGASAKWYSAKWYRRWWPMQQLRVWPSAFVEWFVRFNPFERPQTFNGCDSSSWFNDATRTKAAEEQMLLHALDNGELEEWKDRSEELRSLARRCFSPVPWVEATYERHVRQALGLPVVSYEISHSDPFPRAQVRLAI